MSDVRLIQVPYYLGREHANLSRGPAKLADAIEGDSIVIQPPRPNVLPNEVAESFSVIRAVASAVRETVEEGRFPLVLAVNCFTSLGTVAGVGRDVGVVWFDAHGDFHTPDTTTSGFLDGMGLAMLLGDGWRELRNTVEGLRPVPAEHALLVGARDIDPTEQDRFAESPLRRADVQTLDEALEELSRQVDAVYVHLDLDVIDPAVARANELSVEGGFGAEELEQALAEISSRFEVAAAAMTAYDPSVDGEDRMPPIAATLARRLVPERVER
jgi:arginase